MRLPAPVLEKADSPVGSLTQNEGDLHLVYLARIVFIGANCPVVVAPSGATNLLESSLFGSAM